MCINCGIPVLLPNFIRELLELPENSHCTGYVAQLLWNKLDKKWTYEKTDYDEYDISDKDSEFPMGNVYWHVSKARNISYKTVNDMVIIGDRIIKIDKKHKIYVGRWIHKDEVAQENILFEGAMIFSGDNGVC